MPFIANQGPSICDASNRNIRADIQEVVLEPLTGDFISYAGTMRDIYSGKAASRTITSETGSNGNTIRLDGNYASGGTNGLRLQIQMQKYTYASVTLTHAAAEELKQLVDSGGNLNPLGLVLTNALCNSLKEGYSYMVDFR
jgi:hypothetical protein